MDRYCHSLKLFAFLQEFHELSHGLLLWLENIDRRRNEIIPIASGLDRHTLRAHYRALKVPLNRSLFFAMDEHTNLAIIHPRLNAE